MLRRLILLVITLSGLLGFTYFSDRELPKEKSSHYRKLDAQGRSLNHWQGPWSCVKDSRNNLIWEVKKDDESIHDGYWTYSWLDGSTGKANGGDCYFEKERCDTDDLIRRLNQKRLCGRSNWRLPTEQELLSLVEKSPVDGNVMINVYFFPHTKRGDYWTSSHGFPLTGVYQHLGEGAKAVNFGSGRSVVIPYRNAAFVRLVTEDESTH